MKQLDNNMISKLKGKKREEIIDFMGEDFHTESDKHTLIYIIKKTWINRKEQALFMEFDNEGRAYTFITLKNYDFKK